MTVPDYAEPLVGWRAWHLVDTDAGVRLHAIGRAATWEPGVAHEAVCLRRRSWRERFRPRHDHAAPDWACTCGVWAARTLPAALNVLDIYGRKWKPLHRVVGTVALWGEVIEHAHGWRAEHAYPVRLYVPSRRLHGPRVEGLERLVEGLTAYRVLVSVVDAGSRAEIKRAIRSAPEQLATA